MKTVKAYISGFAAAVLLSAGFSSCQDDIDDPSVNVPVASAQANTTIADFKAAFWEDASNYAKAVGTKDDGSHYILKGRVVSSDEAGNVFRSISIQDETGALAFSINSYNLYLNYRVGQEIVIDATGMNVGKYAGLFQFGTPTYYENGETWQVGFMAPELFQSHAELNGLPKSELVDTIVVNSFTELDSSPEGLRKWQSQLVRINNVHFQDGGKATFSKYHSNDNADVNKTLVDAEGNSSLVVRTSGYANFCTKMLPEGSGDIVGILSFYQSLSGSSTWQLILNDYEGCMNFGNPTIAPGTENNPYKVPEVVAIEQEGKNASGWVSGYIVGTVAPGVETVTKNDDVVWSAEDNMAYTLVIGAEKDTKDISQALVIQLPANTPLKQLGNLRDNPGNYGKAISVRGTFAKVMGTYGVADNSGAASQFKIEGIQTGGESVPEGDGTADKPFNASQAKAKAIANGSASTDNVYVKGYITAGSINMQYGTGTWTIADNAEGTGETFELFGTYNTDNKKFTDENAVKIGDLVVAVGPIFNYNGKTPEMSKGHLVSINAGGDTPTPPAGNAILSETFTNGSLGSFSNKVVTSGTWTGWRPNTGDKSPQCAIANSYVGGNNEAATAWLYSPNIDLNAAKTASLKVEQAFGFYFPTTQESFCTVVVREKGGQWQQLTLTEFPVKGTGNWTDFAENTIDLSAFTGKTIQIAFKYVNDGKQSIAWELRNFELLADAGSVLPGAGDEPGDSGDTPGGDDKPTGDSPAGTGIESDPYNCAKVIALNPTSKTEAVEKDKWVKGYIIGYMPSNNTNLAHAITTADGCDVQTNLVLAPSADEKDMTKCLPIQLPTEKNAPGIRSALNLKDHPENLGKQVLLNGNIILYCGSPGLKDTKAYKFVE